MSKKSRTIKARRAALDRVLEVVKRESDSDLTSYDIACWILYAGDRSDSILMLGEDINTLDPETGDEEIAYAKSATMEDELKEKRALWGDDADAAYDIIDTQERLAKLYDRGYKKPVLKQTDWL